jgi:hypothetical protein
MYGRCCCQMPVVPLPKCAARGGAHSDALCRRRGRERRQDKVLHVLQQRAALVLHEWRQGAGQLLCSCEQQPARPHTTAA